MASRPATPEDVDAICASLPETWFGTSWGDVPTWLVPHRDKGRGFLLYRQPHKSAIDPETGDLYDDLLVIRTADDGDKQALLAGGGPYFTIPHFNGYNAVLVQTSRLGEISYDELVEVITDAWCACAAKSLVKAFLADRAGGSD
ncbi:hypothetical protein EFK50_06015 [Nocardioides marmoriginsengisoli]|uniref:MmcQ/YjbR family DNA-binding protein n=1 Tax=Nocardioides marmoriginsengisoli TaxID=661483 RepID=A0A3N0CM22_9ACTN|nr:hypothetical protein [Nocardioides marmoriginsengisoli]RNL64096.1 hypothetical protein EFK50_06015 [Nocardioides marmoriginsengisoli]